MYLKDAKFCLLFICLRIVDVDEKKRLSEVGLRRDEKRLSKKATEKWRNVWVRRPRRSEEAFEREGHGEVKKRLSTKATEKYRMWKQKAWWKERANTWGRERDRLRTGDVGWWETVERRGEFKKFSFLCLTFCLLYFWLKLGSRPHFQPTYVI